MNMSLDMIHRDERNLRGHRDSLGVSQPHQQRTCQARPVGRRHRVQIPPFHGRTRERLFHHWHDRPQMFA